MKRLWFSCNTPYFWRALPDNVTPEDRRRCRSFLLLLFLPLSSVPNPGQMGRSLPEESSNISEERPRQFFAGVSLSENCGIGGQIRRKGGKVVSCPYPRKENRKQGRKSRPNGLTRRILCAVHFPEFAAGDGIPGHRPKDGWYRAGSRCVWFHLLG